LFERHMKKLLQYMQWYHYSFSEGNKLFYKVLSNIFKVLSPICDSKKVINELSEKLKKLKVVIFNDKYEARKTCLEERKIDLQYNTYANVRDSANAIAADRKRKRSDAEAPKKDNDFSEYVPQRRSPP